MTATTAHACPVSDRFAARALLAGDGCDGVDAEASHGAAAEAVGPHDGAAGPSGAPGWADHDLHPAVRAFVRQPGDEGTGRRAQDPWAADPVGMGAPLYQRQQVPAGPVVQASPGVPAPRDLARLDQLATTVRTVRPENSPFPAADVVDVQRGIAKATAALRSGDYTTAAAEFEKLGFPLPLDGAVSEAAKITSNLLGVPTTQTGNSIVVSMSWGKGGNQALNDLNGYAANARMMSRFAQVPGVSNPPTEAQLMAYMKATPLALYKHPDRYAEIIAFASEVTEGTIAHYSVAGRPDPTYGANPNPRFVHRDRDGVHEFGSLAEATRAGRPGAKPLAANSPDQWSDITSVGKHGTRLVGDCESKLYLQTRLLTAAGFTSLGSIDVQRSNGATGHMLGVFKAPDGSVWMTSNEDFARVRGSGPRGAVTQADVDDAARKMSADVFGVPANSNTMLFAAAATRNQSGPNAATDTLRRATEMSQLGRKDVLIEPDTTSAAGGRAP